jgi:Flp pilus assembly protein TadD
MSCRPTRPAVLLSLFVVAAAAAGCAKPAPPKQGLDDVLVMRYRMAEELVEKRAYDSAAPYLMDLIARRPNDARLHLLLGIVLRGKGVLDKAKQELDLALRLNPKDPAAHNALGILFIKRRELAAAARSLRKATELAPRAASYHNDLGFCLLAQRKLEDAQKELAEAVRLDPTMRRALNNLGIALGLMGRDAEALEAFTQVGGSRAMALTNMGFVQELRGRPVHARRFYERALKHDANYKPARRNLRALDPQNAVFVVDATEPETVPASTPPEVTK